MSIIDATERALDGIGLMTGEAAIPKRFLFGALIGGFLVTYIKPSSMFEAGRPRPWSLMVSKDEAADATPVPWYFVPVGTGLALSMLI